MFDFMNSTASKFADWAFNSLESDNKLVRSVCHNEGIPEDTQNAFLDWAKGAQKNYVQVVPCVKKEYGLPELEVLRAEACSCIVMGLWQSAMGVTNMLLEKFLKRALQYHNLKEPDGSAKPLSRITESLEESSKKYGGMNLCSTINAAFEQRLIDEPVKDRLHLFRRRFRNAYSHTDMRAMFGEQKIPMMGIDFETQEIEEKEVTLADQIMWSGEAMWQNAKANAIPYFKEVDALIRVTLPKVFPHMQDDQPEDEREDGE